MGTAIHKPAQMIITLEDNALLADIKKALKLIRGVASIRVMADDAEAIATSAHRLRTS